MPFATGSGIRLLLSFLLEEMLLTKIVCCLPETSLSTIVLLFSETINPYRLCPSFVFTSHGSYPKTIAALGLIIASTSSGSLNFFAIEVRSGPAVLPSPPTL